jgi:hypothetical protein
VELVPRRPDGDGAGGGRFTAVSRVLRSVRRPKPVARRYLVPGLTLEQFFDELNTHDVRYVVLRWFETLPDVDPGEDIDLLVADEDLAFVGTLLTSERVPPRRQKFDVYTVSGLSGSDWRGIPYYPPRLAEGLLERSVLLRGRFRVPDAMDHFDSLSYHAVYHKGAASGLPETTGFPHPTGIGEHDYAGVLEEMAASSGLSVPITLKGLDSYLDGKKLRPPLDTLDKLAEHNEWLRDHVDELFGPVDGGVPGLAVFVLRARAGHLLERVCDELRREGFEPLERISLDPATSARVRSAVRGGTWGRGPFPLSGGDPATFVVAYDLSASVGDAGSHDPTRVTKAKLAIRSRLLADVPPAERYNPLHSSDNARQALDYLGLLHDAGVLPRVQDRIERIRAEMIFPFPVVETLPSRRRRAVTAVVRHPVHGESVCKVFYPSARRFMERELRSRTEFAALPEVPTLLDAGDNWLLMPRYTDTGAHVRRRLPTGPRAQLTPRAARALARMARSLHQQGAFLLDLTPQNLMTDPEEGLKVLDWEFLQDLPPGSPAARRGPAASPTVLGRVGDLPDVDVPLGIHRTVFDPVVTGIPAGLLVRAPWRLLTPLMEPGMLVAFWLMVARERASGAVRALRPTARRVVLWTLTRLEKSRAPHRPRR